MLKDEEKQINEQSEVETEESNGLTAEQQALLSLKKNTVSKEKYEEIEKKYNNFVAAVIDGKDLSENAREDEKPSIQDMRKNLQREDISNLEFAQTALNLRKAVMDEHGASADPFVPQGAKITATPEDYQKAQNVADVMQDCIDQADGDSAVFTALLQSRTKDTMPVRSNRRK